MALKVAIVGRPNVGKSTLFNRLVGQKLALVDDTPGVTRDRREGEAALGDLRFRVIDTAGLDQADEGSLGQRMQEQTARALTDADVALFVVDARDGLTPLDLHFADLLRRGTAPVVLVANKSEGRAGGSGALEAFALGLGEPIAISAEHGDGMADLYAALAPYADQAAAGEGEVATTERPLQLAIIGRPNVGKSTLLNALTNSSRAIVSPIAGTTRDAVDEVVEHNGSQYRFVDTAGIRRKGKTHLMAEKLSVIMARRHLEAADVALLIIDATEGVTSTDATIGGYAHESGRSVIIVVNKWDLITTARTDGKPPADRNIFEEQLRRVLKYLDYAPVVFLSAAHRTNLHRLYEAITLVATERRKRVSTGQMNRFLERVDFQRATVPASKKVRIYYMTQAAVAPPTFVLFTDRQVRLHFSYERFLQNQIRDAFGFSGSPIWFKVRARNAKARS
jgi:GTPase